MDAAFGNVCRSYRIFPVGQRHYFGAGKTFCELADCRFDSFSYLRTVAAYFCKIEPKELLPKAWHVWLLSIQAVSSGIIALLLIFCPMEEAYRDIFEGAMVCLICPTATAAAVITGKLGGSASTLTTYTLLSNVLAAIAVPLVFPLVEPHADITFVVAFLKILSKVFPLLLAPFFIALLFRYYIPSVHRLLSKYHGVAFYLWAVALTIVTGQTVRSLVTAAADVSIEIMIALAGLATCCLQFYFGKELAVLIMTESARGRLWDRRIRCLPFGWQ